MPATTGPLVRQVYTVRRALGPSLPFVAYVDRPSQLVGLTLDMDPLTGMVLPVGAVGTGSTYTVTSRAPLETMSEIPTDTPLAADAASLDHQLPAGADGDLTQTLQYLGRLTGQRPAPTVAFLQAALVALARTDRRVDPVAVPAGAATSAPTRGGTSLAEVINATTIAHVGTPEQFATLFVVVARDLGIPARLVTGFRVPPTGPGGVGRGVHDVTNRDAWTWAEVPVLGFGWVVADPTPVDAATGVATPVVSGAQSAPTTQPPPQANAVPSGGLGGHALAPPAALHLGRPGHRTLLSDVLAWGAGIALAILALALLAVGVAAGRRAARRHRRRRGDPAAVAVGAWLEVLDGLSRGGLEPGRSATTHEVADLAAGSYGPELLAPVRVVGDLADRAVFSTRAGVDRAAAEGAWLAARDVGRHIRSKLSRAQLVRATLAVGARSAAGRGRSRSLG